MLLFASHYVIDFADTMKIPPLTEMEPLPPVPSCSRDLGLDEISDNDSDFEQGPSSSSRNVSKLDAGSLLDNEIQEEVRKRAALHVAQ